jgi:hypothetical protein
MKRPLGDLEVDEKITSVFKCIFEAGMWKFINNKDITDEKEME